MSFLARPEAWFCGLLVFLPFTIGVGWVAPDANRHGQPGWLWAALTLPLNWGALLAYLGRAGAVVAPAVDSHIGRLWM